MISLHLDHNTFLFQFCIPIAFGVQIALILGIFDLFQKIILILLQQQQKLCYSVSYIIEELWLVCTKFQAMPAPSDLHSVVTAWMCL